MSFFAELKRRNVIRMAVLYIVAGWVVLQIADVLFDPLGLPAWTFRMVLGLLLLGFPLALIFAWVFEMTPEGLKRERDIDRSASVVAHTGRKMNTVIVVLLVVAIAGLVIDRLIPESGQPAAATTAVAGPDPTAADANAREAAATDTSIAVLPFVNMSGDPDNEYFSDGLSEELMNTLVRLGGLKVTGRTSSFAFKGQNQDLREIGRLLNVANVLEGSVRKAGNRVRITAQLIKTSDGYHLWSDTFDRELDDIFAIQAEIAEQVSDALQVTLLGGAVADEPKTPSVSHNAQAYEEYLRGMYIWQREPDLRESLDSARSHFEAALALDPG
jgi:TolB-like protein